MFSQSGFTSRLIDLVAQQKQPSLQGRRIIPVAIIAIALHQAVNDLAAVGKPANAD